jgi:hypothetical protein
LDQALTDDQLRTVEGHVHECDGCWQELMVLQNLIVDLDDPKLKDLVLNEPSPLPADFTKVLMARVQAEKPAGFNLVLPWLRRKWSSRQYASVAYAMGATAVLASAGNMLFLWNQATDRITVWSAQAQAYGDAISANFGGVLLHLAAYWHGFMIFLHIA